MSLLVLLYHHVGPRRPGTNWALTVSPSRFEAHLRWLTRHAYVGITQSRLLAWLSEGQPLPKRSILLTFDDGYAETADYAFPLLLRYGFCATQFVVTELLGEDNAWDRARFPTPHALMTAEEVRNWANRGIEFGAHSRTHPDLTRLTAGQLEQEVRESRADLEAVLQRPALSFSYPFGTNDAAVRNRVRASFALGFTADDGLNTCLTDPYRLRRSGVFPTDTWLDLVSRLRLGWSPLPRLLESLYRHAPRRSRERYRWPSEQLGDRTLR